MSEKDIEYYKRELRNARERERYHRQKHKLTQMEADALNALAKNDRLIAWGLFLGGSAMAAVAGKQIEESGIVPAAPWWSFILSPSAAINLSVLNSLEGFIAGSENPIGGMLKWASTGAAAFGGAYLLLSAMSGDESNAGNPLMAMLPAAL